MYSSFGGYNQELSSSTNSQALTGLHCPDTGLSDGHEFLVKISLRLLSDHKVLGNRDRNSRVRYNFGSANLDNERVGFFFFSKL